VQVPRIEVDEATLSLGRRTYGVHCMRCHGGGVVSSGLLADLRFASADVHAQWDEIVLGGTRAGDGMASFADLVSREEARAVQAYVIDRGHHDPTVLERLAGWFARTACIPVSLMTD
jgi:quinohemoprotein ethanol dehydrogenase